VSGSEKRRESGATKQKGETHPHLFLPGETTRKLYDEKGKLPVEDTEKRERKKKKKGVHLEEKGTHPALRKK